MHRLRALLLLAVIGLCLAPQLALAQSGLPLLDPGWHIVPDAKELDPSCDAGAPLGIGGVMVLLQNLMNAAVSLTVIVMVLVIAYAGFLFITSPFNSENRTTAKTTLMNTVMGVLLVLAAWLVMDFVMKILYNPEANFAGEVIGPWNEVLVGGDACIKEGETKPLFGSFELSQRNPQVDPDTSIDRPAGGGTGRGGSCLVPSNGPCSIATLQQTCFGSRAEGASRICNLESAGGNSAAKSRSDRLNGGSGPSYSVGLWQINLTVHKVAGLNCPSAFTAPCGPKGSLVGPSKPGACYSQIKPGMERLYHECVAAAQVASENSKVACKLYDEGGFKPWSYSANKCKVI